MNTPSSTSLSCKISSDVREVIEIDREWEYWRDQITPGSLPCEHSCRECLRTFRKIFSRIKVEGLLFHNLNQDSLKEGGLFRYFDFKMQLSPDTKTSIAATLSQDGVDR